MGKTYLFLLKLCFCFIWSWYCHISTVVMSILFFTFWLQITAVGPLHPAEGLQRTVTHCSKRWLKNVLIMSGAKFQSQEPPLWMLSFSSHLLIPVPQLSNWFKLTSYVWHPPWTACLLFKELFILYDNAVLLTLLYPKRDLQHTPGYIQNFYLQWKWFFRIIIVIVYDNSPQSLYCWTE